MKKLICLALALCLVFSLAACGSEKTDTATTENAQTSSSTTDTASTGTETAASGDTIKIGMYAPLTGDSSSMGLNCKNCAELAIAEVNANGGLLGKQVELVCYDDQSSTETAVKDVTRLIQEDHVVGIIGSLHSGNINATGQLVEDAKIPEVGPGLAMSWLQQGWTYLFRSVGNTECSNSTMLQFCVDQGWHNIAVFNSQDDYGTDTGDVFVEYAENYDVELVTRETFNPADSDFTGQAAKIVKAQPDAVMVIAVQNDCGSVIKQLRLAGYDGPILGDSSMGNLEVAEVAGSAAHDCYFSAQYIIPATIEEETDETLKAFYQAYIDKYGEMPTSDTGLRTYDAMQIMFKGIENAGSTDGTAIRDGILQISGLNLLGGTFDFTDGTGEGIHQQRVFVMNDGTIKPYEG